MISSLFSLGFHLVSYTFAAIGTGGGAPCRFLAAGGFCTTDAAVTTMYDETVKGLAAYLGYIAVSLAVLFGVVGGVQLVLSFGDDGKMQKGKTSLIMGLVGLGVYMVVQVISNFVEDQAITLAGSIAPGSDPLIQGVGKIVTIVQDLFTVVITIIILIAGLRMMMARGKAEEFAAARRMLLYAISGGIIIFLSRVLTQSLIDFLL